MKNFNFKFLIAAALVVASQNASALTFEEATQKAFENSHDLKRMRLEYESAKWDQTKAIAGYLPKLELDGRHLFTEKFEVMPFENLEVPALQPYTSFGVSANWEIFNGMRTTHELRAANFKSQAAEATLRRAEEKARTGIRTLFYKALGLQTLVDVADQNIQTLQSHLKDVSSRVRSGVSTKFDSLRVEVQLENAKTDKVAAENNVAVARARLFESIDMEDDGQPLQGTLPEDFSRVDVKKITRGDIHRMDRDALLARQEEAAHQALGARAHWMPKLSAFGSYEWYNNVNHSITESDQQFKPSYMVGVLLSWNLFDGGASYASSQQMALAQAIASENVRRLDQSIPVDLEEAKRKYSYNAINYQTKLISIRKAEEAVRLARGGLRAGTRTNTEVLDAVVDLNLAKAAAIKSQIDAIDALGELELSVGHSL